MRERSKYVGFFSLEVHPELGIAPGLFRSIPTTTVIDKLTREKNPAADLPGHVVSGGEEVSVDHVDFFPNIGRGAVIGTSNS